MIVRCGSARANAAIAGRLNGAALAVAAVPADTGLNDGLFKPLVHRGHTAAISALAATVAVLLVVPPQTATTRPLRLLQVGVVCVLGIVVATGVIGLRWHFFTDTVAGVNVGIGTVCGLALLLDLPGRRVAACAGMPPAIDRSGTRGSGEGQRVATARGLRLS